MRQKVLFSSGNYVELDAYFKENGIKTILLVCGKSISSLRINQYFETLKVREGINVVRFMDFQPNPVYGSVVKGIETKNNCNSIVAVGRGSAIDVAKCIKLYLNMDSGVSYLEQTIIANDVKLLAVPTTAGHAMCYKLTGLYGISHGHAAALCVAELWRYMLENLEQCIDPRGREYLENVFEKIAYAMGCETIESAIVFLNEIINELGLRTPEFGNIKDLDILKLSVNPVRLKNNPVKLETEDIAALYRNILKVNQGRN